MVDRAPWVRWPPWKDPCPDGVTQVEQCKINGDVGLNAGMGLDVREFAVKELAGPFDGESFDLVHIGAAAVVAVAWVAFSVLVGQHAAHSRHTAGLTMFSARDELDVLPLARQLPAHRRADFAVALFYKSNGIHHIAEHVFLLVCASVWLKIE